MNYGVRLTRAQLPPQDPRDLCAPEWQELLPAGETSALYFGAEFCEDRLPALPEAERFCALARDHGLEPTLLTPLVSPHGLALVGDLLDGLARKGWTPAVVFNDWGVLGLVRADHPTLPHRPAGS